MRKYIKLVNLSYGSFAAATLIGRNFVGHPVDIVAKLAALI